MFCPVCNNNIPDGSPVCPVCGVVFQSAAQPPVPHMNQYPVQPMPPANQYPVQPASPVYESKGAGIVAFIFGLSGLICAIIAPPVIFAEIGRFVSLIGWVRMAFFEGFEAKGIIYILVSFFGSLIGTITGSVSSGRSPHFGLGRAGKTLAIIGLVFSSIYITIIIGVLAVINAAIF